MEFQKKRCKFIFLFILFIESFFSSWALMKASGLETGNILTGIFFLFCFLFFKYSIRKMRNVRNGKRIWITSSMLSILFTLFYMGLDARNYIDSLENNLFRLMVLAAVAAGFFFLFFHLLRFLFSFVLDRDRCMEALTHPMPGISQNIFFSRLSGLYSSHIGAVTFLLCMLGYLPYFLYQYPGIMTPDSLNQMEQVLGLIPYSNHHPFMHTALIGLFYRIGILITSNPVTAMAFYTFFQMCIMALSVTCFIKTVRGLEVGSLYCILATVFYAFVPYHAVYAVTVWKDVLFSAGALLFTVAILRLHMESRLGRFTPFSLILYGLSGLMVCLLRSNGWYAFLLSFPFLVYFFWSKRKIMLPVQLSILLIVLLIKAPVMNSLHVVQPDFVESVSIPLQQISCVIHNDRALSEDQWKLINSVIDASHVKTLYNPRFADNMKELVRAGNPGYLEEHKSDYLKLWLKLGVAYPKDYLEAYIQQTLGYWYPDSFYPVGENEGISLTPLHISHTPLIGGPIVVKGKEIALKLRKMLPLYGLVWSMGTLFWVMLICMGCGIVRKEAWKLFLYLPGLAIMATVLIATPVADQFRYAYPLAYTLPLYLILACWNQKPSFTLTPICPPSADVQIV